MNINANEVKTKGVSVFDDALKQGDEVVINVRGKNKYVVLGIDRYNDFRESELDITLCVPCKISKIVITKPKLCRSISKS